MKHADMLRKRRQPGQKAHYRTRTCVSIFADGEKIMRLLLLLLLLPPLKKEVMYSGVFVCLFVCFFVCLFVRQITQKGTNGFR